MAERSRRRRNRGNRTPGFIRAEQARASKRDSVKLWEQRISQARKLREDWEDRYDVEALAHAFNSNVTRLINGENDIFINRMFPTLKAMMPGLVNNNPTFTAAPVAKSATPLTREKAKIIEHVLQSIAKQDDHLKQSAKYAVQQAFFRIGALKVMFDPTREKNPRAGEVMMDDNELPIIDEETNEVSIEPSEIIKDEIYEWRWVDAATLLLPDDGPDMRHWPWVAEEITVPLYDAQDDERFPKSLRDQMKAVKPMRRNEETSQIDNPSGGESDLDPEVTYIEIWDVKEKKRLIWAEGQSFSAENFLLDEPLPEGTEDHPYSFLVFNPVTDPKPEPWPKPVVADWLRLQEIYNTRRQQMINAANRSARKIGYDQATFADVDSATAALQSNVDMEGVELTDISRPWVVLQDPGSPPDIAREMIAERQDWIDVTGQTGARLGNPDSDTATEAIFSERANNLRDVDMREAVQFWLGQAGTKMYQKLQATMTMGLLIRMRGLEDRDIQQYVARTYGPQFVQLMPFFPNIKERLIEQFGNEKFVHVSREDLQFAADIRITPGSARARTLDVERQQLLAFIRILAQFPHIMLSRELMRMVADLFEFVDEALLDELSAVAQQMVGATQGGQQVPGGNGLTPPAGGSNVVAGGLRALMSAGGI